MTRISLVGYCLVWIGLEAVFGLSLFCQKLVCVYEHLLHDAQEGYWLILLIRLDWLGMLI